MDSFYDSLRYWTAIVRGPVVFSEKGRGRIINVTSYEEPAAAYGIPAAPPGPPKCEMCGCNPWILVEHPLNKKRVCLECKTKGTEGWVPCPATHKKDYLCPLCHKTPGFIEEV